MLTPDPYLLPEGNVNIAFSGGRTSGYMLIHILQANEGLREDCRITFQNTGREHPKTLDFVKRVQEHINHEIIWLEYMPYKPLYRQVTYDTASRKGEPFEALIKKKGKHLPGILRRYCTQELKVLCHKRYLWRNGWDRWTNAVGFRVDEPHRLGKVDRDRWVTWTPLVDACVTKKEVLDFWNKQSFDLELATVNGVTYGGNCVDCFLKSEAEIVAHMRAHPEDTWTDRMESLTGHQFSNRYNRAELREYINSQEDRVLDTEGLLCQAKDGECM